MAMLYAINFAHLGISPDTTHWGSLGDYVSGVLNPIVAFAALAVLAYSVSIQRRGEDARPLKVQRLDRRDLASTLSGLAFPPIITGHGASHVFIKQWYGECSFAMLRAVDHPFSD